LWIQFFSDKTFLHSASSSHVSKKNATFKFKGNEDIFTLEDESTCTHTRYSPTYLTQTELKNNSIIGNVTQYGRIMRKTRVNINSMYKVNLLLNQKYGSGGPHCLAMVTQK